MARLLGIDVGTSGVKVVLVDELGVVVAQASSGYSLSSPRPLWSEQDPEDWWAAVQRCLESIGECPDAIGLTGQMHGAVFLDASDQPIRPAILWNDQRTEAECAFMDQAIGADRLRRITCNAPTTGFQAPKILWLRTNEPDAFRAVRSVLLPKDFIRLRLSGAHATDVSDAAGVGLLDVPRRTWATRIIAELGLDPSLFPQVFESAEVASSAKEGLPPVKAGTPIVAGAGDQAAGAVGVGAVRDGVLSLSLGTSGVAFRTLPGPPSGAIETINTFCHANGGWHSMGVMLSCGGAIRWARDTLFPELSFDQMSELASTAPPGCDGLAFAPYLSGERCPHDDPNARGAFVGLTLRHSRAHLARAVFEGATFGLLGVMRRLFPQGMGRHDIRVTGGGARSAFWMQMVADVFESDCATVAADEGPAYGAAILAGVGIGCWPDVLAASNTVAKLGGGFRPGRVNYAAAVELYEGVYPAIRDARMSGRLEPISQ